MIRVKVDISNKQKKVKIPSGLRMLLRKCCSTALSVENFPHSAEVSIRFVDNNQIRVLNKEHRNIEAPTDVLSFPMGQDGVYDTNPETGTKILGDIVISAEQAYKQSKEYGHSFKREMGYLTAHAMLHLLGYDHINSQERDEMRKLEERVMDIVGLSFADKNHFSLETGA